MEISPALELGKRLIRSILDFDSLDSINQLINAESAPLWYQDPEEGGISALHAAAFAENFELVKLLITKGAMWNAIDSLNNTAADIALSMNNAKIYEHVRNAGIRSEMLLTLLSTKSSLNDTESTMILKSEDDTAAGSSDEYLSSKLTFKTDEYGQDICVVNAGEDEVGVMMGWEKEIMEETVRRLTEDHDNLQEGLKVLNIGFGLGIIDSLFQALDTPPSLHVIIEAHPDVLAHMRIQGWYDKSNVRIVEGKWQDVMSSEDVAGVGGFDVVYTDTFSEDYMALKEFFDLVPDLLSGPESRFSFFNGLGATNLTFYDVYTRLSDLHLSDVGLEVGWSDVDNPLNDERRKERWGKTREYFTAPVYRLPIARMALM
ncbi:hypothetical protein BDV98DRAFT_524447 [Pterulicium gracile]|uniref:RMT2 domain-containing protein n=1 Tax=Pterulicium gracile TaxID=1884261 RepID=A0A5C3QRA0_9AGAR|nr:hypothetical protein BDV98DRAFT_524447 [Pterula gracilis]